MSSDHFPSEPFALHVCYGEDRDGKTTITQRRRFNFTDIGLANLKLNEVLTWKNVIEVELVTILKCVRPQPMRRDWHRPPPIVERRSLPPK